MEVCLASDTTLHALAHVIFEITIKGLMLTVVDFEISKIAPTICSC